jgi:pimeloyl-ACP methyl ester carboxylesterase/quercetin dioxygenase-like cupin family protein
MFATTPVGTVSGTLLLPAGDQVQAVVLLVGGTLSEDRDGRLLRPEAPPRDALRRLAEALAAGGYASLRFDPVGSGESRPSEGWRDTYTDQAIALVELVDWLRREHAFRHVLITGESAGAYVACLAARAGCQADGYLFLGPLCSPIAELYLYNFGRLVRHAETSPERLAWARSAAPRDLALGRQFGAMLEAAARGEASFTLRGDGQCWILPLARRHEEFAFPPDEMFRFIQAPALVLAGECDRNVPPEHAARAVARMRRAGNPDASAFRERYTFASFHRPYDPRLYRALLDWLDRRFRSGRGADGAEDVEPRTQFTPARVRLARGVTILEDVTDPREVPGVETLEGRIGPLLLGESSQAHFIEMPPGMFVAEHPHPTESLICTLRGRWVLCSGGRRHLLQPGSLFHFGRDVPTGYEVPFTASAFLLIFKGQRVSESEQQFLEYLEGLAEQLRSAQRAGTVFLLRDLPAEHPARVFARRVNPAFESAGRDAPP